MSSVTLSRLCAISAVGVLLGLPLSWADKPPRTIKLSEVLQIAVRQSPALELATIDVASADASIIEAAGLDDWSLRIVGDGARAKYPARFPAENCGPAPLLASESCESFFSHDLGLTSSLQRSLGNGDTLTLSLNNSWSNAPFNPAVDQEGGSYVESLSLGYTHPFLSGSGRDVARASQTQARVGRTIALLDREAVAIGVIRDVITTYWDLAYALRALGIRRAALVLNEERLRITTTRIKAGALAAVESLAVEQAIALDEEEILRAELSVTDRSLALRRKAGLEIGPRDIDLSIEVPLTARPHEFSVETLLREAFEQSPEIAALEAQKQHATISVEVTDNGLLPRLDLSINGGPNGSAATFFDSVKGAANADLYAVSGTLTYQQSLGNHAADGAHQRARANLYRARVSLADVRAQVASTMVSSIKQAQAAQLRMEISERAIGLAERNIEAEKARFDLGRSTNYEVLQRQDDLKQSKLRHAQAVIDFLKANAYIDSLTGAILQKSGITLAEP